MSEHQAAPTANAAAVAANQLDFYQAMSDFKVMFPTLAEDIIEAVLRANHGAVDSTIDQLLGMSTSAVDDVPSKKDREAMAPPAYSTISAAPPPAYKGNDESLAPPPPYSHYADQCDGTELRCNAPGICDIQPEDRTFQKTPLDSATSSHASISRHRVVESDDVTFQKTPFHSTSQRAQPITQSTHHDIEPDGLAFQQTPFHLSSAVSPRAPAITRKGEASDTSPLQPVNLYGRWTPALLGELPEDFLRHTPVAAATAASTPDTQTPESLTSSVVQRKLAENERRQSLLTSGRTDPGLQRHLDDEHLALMLQNAEFLEELRLDEEFMHSLQTDDMNAYAFKPSTDAPDLDIRRPKSDQMCGYGDDREKNLHAFPFDRTLETSDDHANFRQQLKNMSASSTKKFVDAAKQFFTRKKKTSPKSTTLPGYDWQMERAGYTHLNESMDNLHVTPNCDQYATPH